MADAAQIDVSMADAELPEWHPRLDMQFDSENEAYEFYNTYAENTGFFVRRSTLWTTSKNVVTRRTFVCSREGFREKKKGSKEVKSPRPETRIGCHACMTIRLTPSGRYRVTEFVPNHNHPLATMSMIHMLKAKKMRRKARATRADLVDDSVRTPEFETEDEAYEFYNMYAGRIGFTVRRASMTLNADNVITRRMFVCSREGFREKKKGSKRVKKPRPETRTGCPACMVIRITPSGKYHVSEFVIYHNHQIATPSADMLMPHNEETDGQNDGAKLVDNSTTVAISNEKAVTTQTQGSRDINLIPMDNKNYLRLKRTKAMKMGDVGAILEYLQRMQDENPSFFYAMQVDEEDSMTNFFWADAKSVIDFLYFGDVVCLDTTYKLNGCGRPFALFIGMNHHRQTVIFGAALLYDETVESLKWLFETFKTAMGGRQPQVILTDCWESMTDAVTAVLPDTKHRFCVWHIYLNAVEQLNHAFHGSRTLQYDFSKCLFDYEDEEEFLSAWSMMLDKYELKDNQWLAKLFEDKQKWALAYGRETFYADMKSLQQKDALNSELKKHLSLETSLSCFFEQYEKLLDERRCAELQADLYARQNTRKPPSIRMLKQAFNAYTPAMFKTFEKEFELYMDCMLYSCGEHGTVSKYKVLVEEKPKEHFVTYDSLDGTVTCSCKKFEFLGIQCRHALKVLDFRNIKELPPQYILKRWRKDAKAGTGTSNCVFPADFDFESSLEKRYSYLCHVFSLAAARGAKTIESYAFIESQSDVLMEQVEQILRPMPADIPSLTNIPDGLQNPVDNVISGSLHLDRTDRVSLLADAANGIFGPRHLNPSICWGQFPAGPPEE